MKWIDLLWRLVQVALGQWERDWARWRWQLLQSLLLVMLAAMCGLAVLLLAATLVMLMYWDTHRLEALCALVLAYAWLAVWMVRRAARQMHLTSGASSFRREDGNTCGDCAPRSRRTCRGN